MLNSWSHSKIWFRDKTSQKILKCSEYWFSAKIMKYFKWISIDDLLPMLYCDHIFMFDYAYIIGNILNFYDKTSLLLNDNIKNTELLFNKRLLMQSCINSWEAMLSRSDWRSEKGVCSCLVSCSRAPMFPRSSGVLGTRAQERRNAERQTIGTVPVEK